MGLKHKTPHTQTTRGKRVKIVLRAGAGEVIGKFVEKRDRWIKLDTNDGVQRILICDVDKFIVVKTTNEPGNLPT